MSKVLGASVGLTPTIPATPQNAPGDSSRHTPSPVALGHSSTRTAASPSTPAAPAVPATPNRPIQHRNMTTPTTYALAFIGPDQKLLKCTGLAAASTTALAKQVQNIIYSLYYPLLKRTGEPTSVSITGALITERRDQQPICGMRHDIKAASLFNWIHTVIQSLETYLNVADTKGKHEILDEYYQYLRMQMGSIQSELRKLPEAKKEGVKNAVKVMLRPLLDQSPPPESDRQKELVQRYHSEELLRTPERLTSRSRTIRAEAKNIIDIPLLGSDSKSLAGKENIKKRNRAKKIDFSGIDFVFPSSTASAQELEMTPRTASTATAIPDVSKRQAIKFELKKQPPTFPADPLPATVSSSSSSADSNASARLSKLSSLFNQVQGSNPKRKTEDEAQEASGAKKREKLMQIQQDISKDAAAKRNASF